jgi:integrase
MREMSEPHDDPGTLHDALLATLNALWDARQAGKSKSPDEHCYLAIRRAVERARTLPPTPRTFRRWFRAACRHADGSDYAPSQRALFVRHFNAVGLAWHEAGLTPEMLRVCNYRRRQPQGAGDPRVLQVLTYSQFHRLRRIFLDRLVRGELAPEPWEAFCQLAFALIAFGGMAWPGVLASIADLRWDNLRTAAQGYITIHRRDCRFRFYLPPLASALALVIGTHLDRPRVFGEPEMKTSILLPIEEPPFDPAAGLTREEYDKRLRQRRLRRVRYHFNCWLPDLCQEAGVPIITVRTLNGASRLALVRVCGQVIAGALLGQTPYAPLSDDQLDDLFESYCAHPFRLPEASATQAIVPAKSSKRPVPVEAAEGVAFLAEGFVADLHSACQPLIAGGPAPRTMAAEALEALACRLLGEIGTSVEDDLPAASRAAQDRLAEETQPRVGNAACFNVACLAAWLAHLCRTTRKNPDTLRAYRSAGAGLVRQFPGTCWFELDEEDAQEATSLNLAAPTRSRLLTVLTGLLSFVEEQLGVAIIGVDRDRIRILRKLQPVRLLRQSELERLLAYLLGLATHAHNAGNAHTAYQAYNAFLGTLLAAFFGLRAGELPRLLLGDMVLDAAQPYLRVWRSKRGRSRVVLAWKVSAEVLVLLREEWARRSAVAGGDLAAPFLADGRGNPVNARSVADTVIEAMDTLGLRSTTTERRPVVFHTLRHVFANRLLVLGVSLRDVARALGHRDTDTTTGSYLHCFDYLQRRRLAERPAELEHPGLPAVGVGALLGIGRTAAIAALKKAGLPAATTDGRGRRLFSWESIARLVADRLRIDEADGGKE